MDRVEVIYDLLVKAGQFPVQVNRPISFGLRTAFSLEGTAFAALTFIDFFRAAIFVALHWPGCLVNEFLSVRADGVPVVILPEIHRPVRVVPVFRVLRLLVEHRELHELLHALFLAVEIVVV